MPPLVVDIGTVNTRIGLGSSTTPECVFPSVVAELKNEYNANAMAGIEKKDVYVGNEVATKRALLRERSPVEMGRIDFEHRDAREDLVRILEHGAERAGSSLKRLVYVEPTHVTRTDRERLAELLFSTKLVDELWLLSAPPLALFASGRTTGCVVEAGESNATVVPILEGHPVARQKWGVSELSGHMVTNELDALLKKHDRLVGRQMLKQHILRSVKEQHCYCSLNRRDDEHQAETDPESLTRIYELPDGNRLCVGEERFRCGEVLFTPTLTRVSGPKVRGLHLTTVKAITSCHEKLQPKLFQNIVPFGGVSLMHCFRSRLQQELNLWMTESQEGLEAKKNFKFTKPLSLVGNDGISVQGSVCVQAWKGGSILSQLSSFDSMKITSTDLKENGAAFVHRKQMVTAVKEK
eukprot:TRINITY_DN3072_c0_g1_i2.p1 TRINITY_DN3072_c0_g1~~TRINITY_DN3072_c0_g1_i2.p1  ORF type:complete len:409 (+),score=148.08 TRINITY_DN3072_c0_g1_i2:470-1696(+)